MLRSVVIGSLSMFACSSADPPTKPSDAPVDKPIDKPIDKPVDKPIDKPVDKPIDKPKPITPPPDAAGVASTSDASTPADATVEAAKPTGPKRPPAANVKAGSGRGADNGIDAQVVRKIVMANADAIRRCYTDELAKRPEVDGKIGVTFVIGPSGDVINSMTPSGDRVVGDCINAVIKRSKFPARPSGTVTINYPFVFEPSE